MASPSSWTCLRRNQRSQNSILFILAFQSCSASSQELYQYLWYNGQYHSGRYFWSRGCLSKYKDSCELQSQVDACSWTAHHRIAADEDFWQTYHWNWTDGQMHFLQIRLGEAPRSPSRMMIGLPTSISFELIQSVFKARDVVEGLLDTAVWEESVEVYLVPKRPEDECGGSERLHTWRTASAMA